MSENHSGTTMYLMIGAALLGLTALTVGASYIDLSLPLTITLALLIATFKSSLVACYFMHLLTEQKLIYIFLILTVIGFFACFLLPVMTTADPYGQGWQEVGN